MQRIHDASLPNMSALLPLVQSLLVTLPVSLFGGLPLKKQGRARQRLCQLIQHATCPKPLLHKAVTSLSHHYSWGEKAAWVRPCLKRVIGLWPEWGMFWDGHVTKYQNGIHSFGILDMASDAEAAELSLCLPASRHVREMGKNSSSSNIGAYTTE